ncbi:DUF6550 family protein [Eisenbergiella sp.]
MKLTEKKKKYLAAGGGLVICVLLLAAISMQFKKEPTGEDIMPEESQETTGSVIEPEKPGETESKETEIVIHPNTIEETETNREVDSRSAQTDQPEQSIQPEVVKPEEPEEAVKTDPAMKPDGMKVETPPVAEDHDTYTPPADTGTENSNNGGGIPGFDNVPDGGANQVINGQSDGDINKQVGIMD